jgi:hypothetical protein
MKVTGTPEATPTVYWMSKFYSRIRMQYEPSKKTHSFIAGGETALRI